MPINKQISIHAAVGAGPQAVNVGADVKAVQTQLNDHMGPGQTKLIADSIVGPKTIGAIRAFQRSVCRMRWPDGRVDPRGKTETALNDAEAGKLFSAMPQVETEAPEDAAPAQPVDGYLYLHGIDAPGVGKHASNHAPGKCHHVIIDGQNIRDTPDLLGAKIAEKNLSIMDMVVNTHGTGAGTLSIKGQRIDLEQNPQIFKKVVPHLKSNARITIFACAFATPFNPTNDGDAWWVGGNELAEGKGTRALQACANFTNREVRAGFGMQFGDMTGFTGVWANATPSGKVTFHIANKVMSFSEYCGMLEAMAGGVEGQIKAQAKRAGAWLGF